MIKLKRAYEPASADDGTRLLVQRLWPRGVKKAALAVDAWLKEVAPSDDLRRWFAHDPERWEQFRQRYFRQLDRDEKAWAAILAAARRGRVTLVYSAHDAEHNNAVALKEYLETRGAGKTRKRAVR
jgi:uncharacterized protein YeaO (DUF488 family)